MLLPGACHALLLLLLLMLAVAVAAALPRSDVDASEWLSARQPAAGMPRAAGRHAGAAGWLLMAAAAAAAAQLLLLLLMAAALPPAHGGGAGGGAAARSRARSSAAGGAAARIAVLCGTACCAQFSNPAVTHTLCVRVARSRRRQSRRAVCSGRLRAAQGAMEQLLSWAQGLGAQLHPALAVAGRTFEAACDLEAGGKLAGVSGQRAAGAVGVQGGLRCCGWGNARE